MQTLLNAMLGRLCRALDALAAALLAVMVVLVFGNVVLRYAFNSGITLSEEVSRWLFVWLTFVGAVVAIGEHGHLGTDVLVGRLGPRGRRACRLAALLAMLVVTAMVFRGSLAQLRINWDVEAPVTGASMAWFYAAGVAFAVLATALLLAQLLAALRGDAGPQAQQSEEPVPLQALSIGRPGAAGDDGSKPAR